MRRIVLSLLLPLALAAGSAGADTLLTMKTHTDASAVGQPNRDSEIKVWVSPDNQHLRRDEATFSLLLLLDKSKMYLVDNQHKTYNEVDLPVDFKKIDPVHGGEMAEQMQAMTKMDVSVKPTNEQKKVSAWNAKKYEVSMSNPSGLKISSDMWMSQDVGIDSAAFAKMQAHMTSLSAGSGEWAKKLSQIPGFPVLTETRVTTPGGVIKSTQELASVDKKPAPAGTYSLPSGYTKTAFGTMSTAQPAGAPGRPAMPPPAARPTAPAPPVR